MKVELSTNLVPMFSGTYETQWEVMEYNDNGDEQAVEYDHSELMQTIANEYQIHAGYILSELNCDFIKKITFTKKFYSPREYNFATDTLCFDVEIDENELAKTLETLENDQEFETFLHDNYTSYDGFMSFTPNNIKDLYIELAKKEHSNEYEQSIGAIITYLAKDNLRDIENSVYDDWQGNGYGGLDYKVVCWEHDNKEMVWDDTRGDYICTEQVEAIV